MQVPVGVEKLLWVAAQDDDFKARLLDEPDAMAAEAGITLRRSEAAMLSAITPDALDAMIASIVPENPRRRKFMGLVAAAATSLAAGTAVISCDGASGDVLLRGATADTDVDGGDDGGTDTDTDVDTDTDADTDTDMDGGTDTDTDTDTDTVDTETMTDQPAGIDPDASVDGNFAEFDRFRSDKRGRG